MATRLMSLIGIAVLLAIAVALSRNRRGIDLRMVGSAFALQVAVALFVLYLPPGRAMIQALTGAVQALIEYSGAGIDMVFGHLGSRANGLSVAVHVLPIVVFFASLMSVLYHLGIMQVIVRLIGGAIQLIVGTHKVESLNAAANVFLGHTEAPLTVRPYLKNLTDAQLFTIMVSGMASVAGTVMAAYAQMGIRVDYLLAASMMSAPGGLLMAKIMLPDGPRDLAANDHELDADERSMRHGNVILAAANGAADGLRLAVNIGAMLIAFVALIALLNGIVGGLAGLAGFADITMERLLGYLFAPLMFLLSVPWAEAQVAGALFGEKLILNEFVAYLHLTQLPQPLSPRTEMIAVFSLCGFANLSSIAILLGGLGVLVPEKREMIGKLGLRALAAGSLSNLMSAALAGLLFAL
jgi:CNT family concentrative nucleoside transporter